MSGQRLRAIREERELTLAEVARRAGIHEASLSNIERGARQPSAQVYGAICRALRIAKTEALAEGEAA